MPLFALEQIVLLSFAVARVWFRVYGSPSLHEGHVRVGDGERERKRFTSGRENKKEQKGRKKIHVKSTILSSVPRFFRYVLLLVLLDASSCTQIPTLITVAGKMERLWDNR